MTAAYRLRGLGWFACGVVVVLIFYIVSLHVAAERARVVALDRQIRIAELDIRRLETEFNTRASYTKLARLNAEKLGLTIPASSQFVHDEQSLASIDVDAVALPTTTGDVVRTAAYFIPTAPEMPVVTRPSPTPATQVARAEPLRPTMGAAATATGAVTRARAEARPPRLAMLDRKLLSDATLGDLVASANAEARGLR